MKKYLFLLFMAVAGFAHAVTDTPTFTPTITPTFTPTPTWTPSPTGALNQNMAHEYISPRRFVQDDGVTIGGTSALPGATSFWYAQFMSQTVAVISTGTAAVRWDYVMPSDYKQWSKGFKAYAYIYDTASSTTVAFTMNIYGQHFNQLTSTAWAMTGTAKNITTQGLSKRWPSMMSRVLLNTPGQLTTAAGVNNVKPGDLLNFELVRTAGTSGNIYIGAIEIERDYLPQVSK